MDDLRPPGGDDWLAMTDAALALDVAVRWASVPSCGAVVSFTGITRDHSEGRSGVRLLDYEAYDEQVIPALRAVAGELRARWPDVRRVALWHRIGEVPLSESSVVVVVSSPHRDDAFEAARFGIDTLKATVPLWKREVHDGGEDWAEAAVPVRSVASGSAS